MSNEHGRLTKGQRRRREGLGVPYVMADALVENAMIAFSTEFSDGFDFQALVYAILEADAVRDPLPSKSGSYSFVTLDENNYPDAPAVIELLKEDYSTVWVEVSVFHQLIVLVLEAGRRWRHGQLTQGSMLPWHLRLQPEFDDLAQAVWRIEEIRFLYQGLYLLDAPRNRILNKRYLQSVVAGVCHHPASRQPVSLVKLQSFSEEKSAEVEDLIALLTEDVEGAASRWQLNLTPLLGLGRGRDRAARQVEALAGTAFLHSRLLSTGLEVCSQEITLEEARPSIQTSIRQKNIKGTPEVYRNVVQVGAQTYPLWEYVVMVR